jgi:hypothetical protein
VEAIYVPLFRAGRFDELDEESAPFNPRLPFASAREEPVHSFRNAQGGVRMTATTGRVDWSLSTYHGFEPLPLYEGFAARFPRFTMIGGDFETVHGPWGVRGEVAAFVERTLQLADAPLVARGQSVEAGIGIDRKAGDYRVSGNMVYANRILNIEGLDKRDLLLVTSIDRSFARETRRVRAFAAYNPGNESGFARVIGAISLRDGMTLEGSAGLFAGAGNDVFGSFSDRDFLYVRLKVFY